ncbi:MAG: U32 family peptidase [Oscillospiraceae bacterium]|nr:U32 family peptidase [Oscillospiraceae bacterium]
MSIELLSPAGDMEKLKSALLYGADAVYMAGNVFGMRAAATNFSVEEIFEATKLAHSLGKKLYLTVNTMPHWYEYETLEGYLNEIKDSHIDALIISDIGVLETVKKVLPKMEIHISTQANTVSHAACNAWHKLGASRIVLARELNFDEIRAIRSKISPELELECFVHGSMCISYSGRCLISGNLNGRDANRGACSQPCRWNYKMYEIEEEKRPGERMPVMENEQGTFIMASKDMCMIEHIPDLMECGINCFKIEGRMRSAYYTACVTNAYRMAIDSYSKDKDNYKFDPLWKRELESVSHRDYSTGFFYDKVNEEANISSGNKNVCEQSYYAIAEGYDAETGLAYFRQRNKFSSGDKAELLTPGKVGRAFTVDTVLDENKQPIDAARHPGMYVYVKTPFEVKPGDILRSSFE